MAQKVNLAPFTDYFKERFYERIGKNAEKIPIAITGKWCIMK